VNVVSTPTPTPRPFQVTLIGSSYAGPETCAAAEAIGELLAENGITLVTGGGGGVMAAAARGAARRGGLAVGILPGTDAAAANPWCGVVIPTGLGHARNALTALAGDAVIVLGGAAGTLSEIAFAWMHGRPILTLAGHGGWADRIGEMPIDDREGSWIVPCASIQELEARLLELLARRDDPRR